MSGLALGGRFFWEIWSPDDTLLLQAGSFSNGIISDSRDDLLDTYFDNGSTESAWYLFLIDNTSFSALAATDTMASHSGWTEFTDYDEAARPAWGPDASASGVKANSTAVQFTMSSDAILKGLGVVSNSTKGGTTGTLWAHGTFSVERSVPTGQIFKAFYELTARQG